MFSVTGHCHCRVPVTRTFDRRRRPRCQHQSTGINVMQLGLLSFGER